MPNPVPTQGHWLFSTWNHHLLVLQLWELRVTSSGSFLAIPNKIRLLPFFFLRTPVICLYIIFLYLQLYICFFIFLCLPPLLEDKFQDNRIRSDFFITINFMSSILPYSQIIICWINKGICKSRWRYLYSMFLWNLKSVKNLERKINEVSDGKYRTNREKSELYSIQSYILNKGYIMNSS